MPVANAEIIQAVRDRLVTLRVAEASAPVAHSLTGFTRLTGSFLTDRFLFGMEVTALYGTEEVGAIAKIVVDEQMVLLVPPRQDADPDGLYVGLPLQRGWENEDINPSSHVWWVDEDYLSGPSSLAAGNYTNGELDITPAYVLRLYGLSGIGIGAVHAVADGIVNLFPPGSALITTGGTVVRVRGDTAPFKGQLLNNGARHAVISITIPLRVRTPAQGV
jgi:hypothetical protein